MPAFVPRLPVRWLAAAVLLAAIGAAGAGSGAGADASSSTAAPDPAASAGAPGQRPPSPVRVTRSRGRLQAADLGLVINVADPYSVQVGEFYARERGLAPAQVLRVVLPVQAVLGNAEFESFAAQIAGHFGDATQALALAWRQPYAVGCQSITGALALGLDAGLCARSCAATAASPYFNSGSARPWRELRLRPSMLLAARDVPGALALIERGVASDRSLGRRGAPPVVARYVATNDAVRSVRSQLFPRPVLLRGLGVQLSVERPEALVEDEPVLLYQTGAARVDGLDRVRFVPGALADHLTSFGGRLEGQGGQMSATAWIDAGATASYGTVSEPCNHLQKFPHPQLLLLHYLQGSTAIEAYWKSVAWPSQGVFIGEPLAAPFARP